MRGSEAFHWIDRNADYMLEAPDEAFDWIYMFKPDDWKLVEELWDQKPDAWREAFAYIVCEGPAGPSRNILLRAICDANQDVAGQAAQSLLSQEELGDIDWTPLDLEIRRLVVALAEED